MKIFETEEMVWVLYYEDSNGDEHFCGSFPTAEEAQQHQREGLGHLRREDWRYAVQGYPAHLLRRLDREAGCVAC
jgi:hypothetical protein